MHKAELARRRDNVEWLAKWIGSIDAAKRPRLNIQISGDHAEFYLQDDKGLSILRDLWKQGHELGTHMHRNAYDGEFMRWSDLRPSRPMQRPQLQPGDVMTPGTLPEPNSLDEVRKLWNDNFRFTNLLLSKITGITGAAEIRKMNNHGEFHLPNSWESKDVMFKEYGITVETGGRNEVLNMIFDHDVFNPWRPDPNHELGEKLSNKAYVCVPQLAVVGNIKDHFGVPQDLSLGAMQRRFLHLTLERREQERLGLPAKVWTFGWTMHAFDLNPETTPRRASQRENVMKLVEWINANFSAQSVRWTTPNGVANEFYAWEAKHPGQSSFHYPYRRENWDAYPYRLKGVAKAVRKSHYVRAIAEPGIQLHELVRVKPGGEWYNDESNQVQVRGGTERIWIAWTDSKSRNADLSKHIPEKISVLSGQAGTSRQASASSVPVGPEPMIIEQR